MLHLLAIFSKGKGMLVAVYFMACLLVTGVLVDFLHKNTTGIFSTTDLYTTIGVSCLLTAAWTYLTKDSYYKDRDGSRKKKETVNSFFLIPMKIWAIIFAGAGLFFLGNLLFHYLQPATL